MALLTWWGCGESPDSDKGERSLVLRSSEPEQNLKRLQHANGTTKLVIDDAASMSRAGWDELRSNSTITSLVIRGDRTEDGLHRLARVDSYAVQSISALPNLRSLELVHAHVEIALLPESLERPENLRELRLLDVRPGIRGLASGLRRLINLRLCTFEAMSVDREVLSGISSLQSLEQISLSHGEIGRDAMRSVRNHPNLRKIALVHVQNVVSGSDIRDCLSCPHLESLALSGSQIAEDALDDPLGAQVLRWLYLGKMELSGLAASNLAAMRSLETLGIEDTRCEDTVFERLANLPALKTVMTPKGISLAHLLALGEAPTLETVVVSADSAAVQKFRQRRPDLAVMLIG